MKAKVAVIGGGAAGSAAAYRLNQLGYDVTVIEKQTELGGRIKSRQYKGENYELGAAFITAKLYSNTFKIIKEANLTDNLRFRHSKVSVVKSGEIIKPINIIGNKWLTFGAKLSLLKVLIYVISKRKQLPITEMWRSGEFDNENAEHLFTPKYRQQISNYLLDPILDGYFYWQTKNTSKAMLMILINALFRKGKTYTLKNGLQQIPKYLAKNSTVITDCEVTEVVKLANNKYEVNTVHSGKAKVFAGFDGIVCATTATVVPKIFKNLNSEQKEFFLGVSYSSTVTVASCFEREKLNSSRAISFPVVENKPYSSFTTDSGASANGSYIEVVKAYANSKHGSAFCAKSNNEITKSLAIPPLLKNILPNTETPNEIAVQKWPEALPESKVGHIKNLQKFAQGNLETGCVAFAGDYIGGPFIEGAIASGLAATDRIHAKLS